MFDFGFGEILLVLLIVFLICPKDIPKILRKIGQFLAGLEKLKDEIFDIKKDITDSVKDVKADTLDDFKILNKNKKGNKNLKKRKSK